MANVSPTLSGSARGFNGVTINATGAACVGTITGDWVVGADEFIVDGMAIHYDEDGGTGMTQAVITIQVQVGSDATAYAVSIVALTALSYTITLDTSDIYLNLWPVSAAAGAFIGGGIKAVRATAVITGTGAANDALKVTFTGRRL